MSNVVPLRPAAGPLAAVLRGDRETAAVASSLLALVAGLREASEQVTGLPRSPLEVERTVQCLFDAAAAVERALDIVTDEGERLPF